MLCLTRKVDEAVNLYHNGELLGQVVLLQIRSDKKVRLGFDFRPSVGIARVEVDPYLATKDHTAA